MSETAQNDKPWENRVFRDPHGRGLRQPLFGARVPSYRTKAGRFDAMIVAQLRRLHQAWPQLIDSVQCGVEDVPPSDPLPWEEQTIKLSRYFPAHHGQPARIVLYRKPFEAAGRDSLGIQFLVRDEMVSRLAEMSGMTPEEIDPDWGM